MGDQLSQEEIDLLLQGADDFGQGSSGEVDPDGDSETLSTDQINVLTAMFFQGLQAGTSGLSQFLAKKVHLSVPAGEMTTRSDLEKAFSSGHAALRQKINGNMPGRLGLILPVDVASRISDLVMGGSGGAGGSGLDSAQIATLKDTLSPFVFNSLNQVSVRIGTAITPQVSDLIVMGNGDPFPFKDEAYYLRIDMKLTIEGVSETRIHLAIPLSVCEKILQFMSDKPQIIRGEPGSAEDELERGTVHGPTSDIHDVAYPQFNYTGQGPTSPNNNLLMDVQMTLTVELGRTRMFIKDILGLGEGSIIELDKLAGEPVDLLVNSKLIAKGEVVVIDENFGVRVTDIVSPVDRVKGPRAPGED